MKQVAFAVILAALAFGGVGCAPLSKPSVFFTTSSPQGAYKVEMSGHKNSPSVPFIDHETRFSLFKNGQPLVVAAPVYTYDILDSGFAEKYPEGSWVNDSVLRFGYKVAETKSRTDSLSISNYTDKTIKYLKITVEDLLFVFEMPPKSKMKLPVPHGVSLSWIWVAGEFEDGQPLKSNGANFSYKDQSSEPLRYCVSVDETVVKVESPMMEGYIDRGTSIPKAENCDL